MSVHLLYHDLDSPGGVSPFDQAILRIARGDKISLACPYIGLKYLCRVIQLAESWRLLTDVEEWLRSQGGTQRNRVYDFLVQHHSQIRHCPRLHAKVVIGACSAMLGSANLTNAGVRQRIEVAVCFEDEPHVQELSTWFNAHWTKAYELKKALLNSVASYMKSLPQAPMADETAKPVISLPLMRKAARLVPLSEAPLNANSGLGDSDIYVNFGHGDGWREWPDACKYKFICAGGGHQFSAPLKTLAPGNRVWVYAPKYGYVGVARVTGVAERASRFQVRLSDGKQRPVMEVVESPNGYHSKHIRNAELCEYFVPVHWLETKPLEEAVAGSSEFFQSPNIVCRPKTEKWWHTLEQLRREFPSYNQ